MRRGVSAIVLLLALAAGAAAQQPPNPVAPAVITRNEERQATVRAVRLAEALRIDGKLDEAIYTDSPPITDFIQTLPRNGEEPTERTEAWVMFDANNFYVAARCWDSAPPDKWIANEMRRDANQVRQNDHFGFMIDTFHDRRNGYVFYSNPVGGRIDLSEADEGNSNADWNPVWEVRTGRFDGGWTIEMAIPFKSIRYMSGSDQTWGIQMRRAIRRKNEWVHLTPLPTVMGGAQGFFRISAAATLIGLELPPASRNIEIKPYGIARSTTDHVVKPAVTNDGDADFGVDAKYGITANLTADLTYNTDFAQVEVDEQQVNLTRFNIQLPEKREFFLEGRGIFSFAAFPTTGSSSSTSNTSTSSTPLLFYSRRIGLNANRVIPIDVGGRVTGKVGKFSLGMLNITTADDQVSQTPQTNFSVLRVKRDVFRRSAIGAMFTNRSESVTRADASNQGYGVDGIFNFFTDLTLGGYYSRTNTTGVKGDDESYQARVDYAPDLYGFQFEQVKVGDAYSPEVGFLRRRAFDRTFGEARYSPRPKNLKGIRQITMTAGVEYIESSTTGFMESRSQTGRINVERENSDQFSVEGGTNYERLPGPFNVAPGVIIPPGGYNFNDVTFRYAFGQQRRLSGTVAYQTGEFYDGTINAITLSSARVSVMTRLSVEPSVSINDVSLPYGEFTTTVLRARSDYAFSPRMFASGLVQYSNSDHTFSSNLRFRWEYLPGSELFVVYTDERDTAYPGYPELRNRAFVVKINRLFRF